MISVRIFREHQKKLIWAFIINSFLVFIAVLVFSPGFYDDCGCTPYAKDKSRLKQIGTTVAIYYSDGRDTSYPLSPTMFEIDPTIINQADQCTWESISQTSPYFFLVDENDHYTGSKFKPVAIRKKPIKKVPINHVVFEDGHVESRTIEETKQLIDAFYLKKFIRYTLGKEWIKNDYPD